MKKLNLSLVGLDGNAFSLMGAFRKQAKKEGWSEKEINKVLDEATSGDYSNLVCTLNDYCNDGDHQDENN
jgi:hypothetical protein